MVGVGTSVESGTATRTGFERKDKIHWALVEPFLEVTLLRLEGKCANHTRVLVGKGTWFNFLDLTKSPFSSEEKEHHACGLYWHAFACLERNVVARCIAGGAATGATLRADEIANNILLSKSRSLVM